ncbi:DNA polymerase III subunit delta' [Oleiharenicola lentus]|uniref:DNA polymerase III subunit delta n=1 Tax=Oleiharenicola lentus TaxID=2508720 RepID=A0A4Q1CAJ5_9BACT|nr:DNA polymerase III subunit delta' [Oleiharenicola lentus]RXK56107.1 DNA polymerase III subunit delta' [Oleiharenicola lentus]
MSAPTVTPWPPALAGTPTVSVLERAIERQRLAHSLLLHGENLSTLASVAHAIADRLLNDPRQPTQYFPPKQHPDFLALRPAGKSRQIGVEPMREIIGRIQVSPQVSLRKVLVVYEADRMNIPTANVFLKTLEEPTASTTILLLTTRPYSLLPTIRSRCLHFRFTDDGHEALVDADAAIRDLWKSTLADYAAWLGHASAGQADKRAIADQVMAVYGLITRFNAVLAAATDQIWKQQKEKLPEDLGDDEQAAIETGIANGVRTKLFAEIERTTRDFAMQRLAAEASSPETVRRAAVGAIAQLEHDTGLLRLNLNESAALENFLLSSLRIWARR